jgi:DAACS family dicarboxylate/amino acid:cation (Na+ or H+) symporter
MNAPESSPTPGASPRRKLALHTRIFIGFGAGAAAGLLVNLASPPTPGSWSMWAVANLAEPAGKIFLRLLLMTVVPLVVTSLTLGVAGLGDARRLGRVGLKTLALTLVVSSASVGIGLFLANAVQPGRRVPAEVREHLFRANRQKASEAVAGALGGGERSTAQALVELVPDNPFASAAKSPPDMLALMLFSVVLGIALALSKEKGQAMADFFESTLAVLQKVIALVLALAPVGVAALLFAMTARFGLSVLRGLLLFVATVLAGLLFHQFVVYSALLRFLARVSPLEFFRRTRTVMATAFATSSSNATLPTALRAAEERLHLPREVSTFVLTVGATANQNGTALYEGVTVLFLAQLFGVDLTLGQQLMLLAFAILAGVGTAGVPSGSIPFIVLILQSIHVPPEGIAVILGVDRLLDMCRTVPNVIGDLVLATVVARSEGADILRDEAQPPALAGPSTP